MTMYGLADRLHKTLDEVGDMSFEELSGWIAYFRILRREEKS